MSINTPPITPQQYEVLHGGGAEAAEIAKQRLSRRRFLRRSLLAVFGLSATSSVAGAVNLLLQRHPIHSALSLIVVMGSLAVLYLLLGAPFLVAIARKAAP